MDTFQNFQDHSEVSPEPQRSFDVNALDEYSRQSAESSVDIIRVLMIEDVELDYLLIREMLSNAEKESLHARVSFDMTWAASLKDGLFAVESNGLDVIVLDLSLPDVAGIETFRRLKTAAGRIPIIVLTGLDDLETAVRTISEGAQDYLVKTDVNGSLLSRAILYATERKRRESEKSLFKEAIVRSEKLRSLAMFAGGVAHSFNNKLMGVLGNIGLAMLDLPFDSPLRARLEEAENTGKRLAELVNQLLIYSGSVSTDESPVSLSGVVEEMGELIIASISEKAKFRLSLEENLPLISVDRVQLGQVIVNLITNASESLGDEFGEIAVSTGVHRIEEENGYQRLIGRASSQQNYVYLEVSDSGSGIDSSMVKRIFDPFYSTKFTGRGMGLAVVGGMVRAHHGVLELNSEPRIGSKFRVMFPVSKSEEVNQN